ncbi:efflux RND transporter periplasmic adaptor subunit [uncultured Draconibacterium sp.]|uniref:efflux RND transporter periplasmic adaptor subunit n=1 Tax=uncultured Draconibacterium sp. TaxID=1573823 RepID=UPI002AA90E30|nr:efflux RND transporter periplasmic adaptor subunit [uncultured Draconibacterium sp.]
MMNLKNSFLFLLITFLLYSCEEKQEQSISTVVIAATTKENVKVYGEYVGNIRAYKYVEIRARVEGYLQNMLFNEGKRVKSNDVLFQIDPSMYRARYEKAVAQLKRDSAALRKAFRDIERIRPLFEQNAASQLDLDNAAAAYDNAEANVAMSNAELLQFKMELDFTTIRSPLDGKISDSYVDMGTLVGPGNKSLLATVVQSDTVFVDFKMTALDYLRSKKRNIQIGELDSTKAWEPTVSITLPDNSVYPLKGVVDFADPIVDPKSGTFGVRAKIANPNEVLLPGQFTKVKFLLDLIEDAIVIPRKALIIEKGGSFVYVMRSDTIAEKRFVQSGIEYENSIVIERGLAEDDLIIIDGQHKIHSGDKIKPVEATVESTEISSTKSTMK